MAQLALLFLLVVPLCIAFEKVLSKDKELVVILHGVPTTKAVGGRSVIQRFQIAQMFCTTFETARGP
jgi:hypothetical protein